jgi:dTDP-glucose 4,6-dehydratase
MRIAVAGGAGFVGSHLCRRLLADGHEVVCVDNLITGTEANVAELFGNPSFRFIAADAADAPDIAVDHVYHLASPASPVDYDQLPLETLAANSRGTWRLLDVAREAGASFLYTSTSEVYGDPLVHPQPESYWGNVDPIGPRACYDEGKRFGEALVTSYRRVHGTRAAIVRIFNTYGPRMRLDDGRVIPELMSSAFAGHPLRVHGDGLQTRSFMYVADLVEGLVRVGLDPASDGQVFNIGNPNEVTIGELAEAIRRRFAPDAEIRFEPGRPGDPQRRRPDISKIEAAYGWRPAVSFEDGLELTATWFRDAVGSGDPLDAARGTADGQATGAPAVGQADGLITAITR